MKRSTPVSTRRAINTGDVLQTLVGLSVMLGPMVAVTFFPESWLSRIFFGTPLRMAFFYLVMVGAILRYAWKDIRRAVTDRRAR